MDRRGYSHGRVATSSPAVAHFLAVDGQRARAPFAFAAAIVGEVEAHRTLATTRAKVVIRKQLSSMVAA